MGWLELLYGNAVGGSTAVLTSHMPLTTISAHKDRLYHFMYNVYANTRIQELFNIIIEFPESEPALMDLKTCLEKTDLRGQLVTSLKTALETRLLHPGKTAMSSCIIRMFYTDLSQCCHVCSNICLV